MELADEAADLAQRLRDARDYLGLTQDEVAKAIGMPRTGLGAIENGQRKVTGLELRRLARIYRRPVAWLLGEETGLTEAEQAILAAARALSSDRDRAELLKFAEFLAGAGRAPAVRR